MYEINITPKMVCNVYEINDKRHEKCLLASFVWKLDAIKFVDAMKIAFPTDSDIYVIEDITIE